MRQGFHDWAGSILKELSREEEAMPEITVTLGDKVVQTLFMDADPVKIGRTPDNDIPIDNLAISRHHATITRLRQYYIIEDHGSSNGTFVNGKEIKKVVLEDKDVITIGKHKLEFRRQKQVDPSKQQSPEAKFAQATVAMRAPVSASPLALIVLEGPQKGEIFEVDRSETRIGRAADNEICLSGWSVAGHHALIRRGKVAYSIESLNRWRGTYVNGQKIKEKVLSQDDKIKIGSKITLLVEIRG